MQYIKTQAECLVSGQKTAMMVPAGTPSPVRHLSKASAVAIGTLLRNPAASWAKVVTFRDVTDAECFLPVTDLQPELIEHIEASGRSFNHGDVFEADRLGAVAPGPDRDEEEFLLVKNAVGRRIVDGVEDFAVTRDVLERPELEDFVEDTRDFLQAQPESSS